jgi:ComF family protein
MDELLPDISPDTVICHVPTASVRVRLRGYDQSELIAKHLAQKRKMRHSTFLRRYGRSRQVGSGRAERFKHLKKALQVNPRASLSGRHVLLIDDITTTGATLEAAANALKEAGAKTVDAIVFAQPQS